MKSWAYYNEHDAFAAAWLRELIVAGQIASGEVDERDIRDVRPEDVCGFSQCHWFGGIGGWSLALRLARWPDDRPVWTGSCPCQGFSSAGRQRGFLDERHLWPAWFHLIDACRPEIVMGEQVASKLTFDWLDLVHDDLEGVGYAVRAVDLPAASVGAPHIRQRLWFMADRLGPRLEGLDARSLGNEREAAGLMGDAGREGRRQVGADAGGCGGGSGAQGLAERPVDERARGAWDDLEWLPCRDGKVRPTWTAERGFQPMADGLWPSMVDSGLPYLSPLATGQKNRVGILRGAGNAIVPQVAAEFIRATMIETTNKDEGDG